MTRAFLLLLFVVSGVGCASANRLPASPDLVALEAQLETSDDGYELRWRLAASCLDLVDAHPDARERDRLAYARKALKYAHSATALSEDQVEGHYYGAIALGRVLQFESLPDPRQISALEAAGIRARSIDPTYKHAGPLRFLAFLYMKAPAWPIGPELAGEEDEIEALWEEALRLASGWVENHLGFAEFLADQDRSAEALAHVRQAKALLSQTELDPASRLDLSRRIQELLDHLSS